MSGAASGGKKDVAGPSPPVNNSTHPTPTANPGPKIDSPTTTATTANPSNSSNNATSTNNNTGAVAASPSVLAKRPSGGEHADLATRGALTSKHNYFHFIHNIFTRF